MESTSTAPVYDLSTVFLKSSSYDPTTNTLTFEYHLFKISLSGTVDFNSFSITAQATFGSVTVPISGNLITGVEVKVGPITLSLTFESPDFKACADFFGKHCFTIFSLPKTEVGNQQVDQLLKNVVGNKHEGILTSLQSDTIMLSGKLPAKALVDGPIKSDISMSVPFSVRKNALVPNSIIGDHSHDHDIIKFITEGSATYTVQGKEYIASKGQFFIIRAGTVYSVKASSIGASIVDGCILVYW